MEKEVAGVWRTVRGRRIFIREGEDLKTAMINSGKFKELRKDYFDKDEKLRNEREEIKKSIYEKQRELNKKHYTGRDLDEDVDDKTQIKDALIKRLNDIETERDLNKEKMFRNQIANEEGLNITKEQFDNLKRNGNVNNLAEKTMKENADKAMTYMGKRPEQIKEIVDEWKAKKNADRFDKARYEEHKQFVDSQIEAWEKTYEEATSDSNYKARLKEMNDRDIVYKEASSGGYKYYTKHGMGPGAVPTDVKISNIKDYDDGMTSFETNRPLSSKELDFYSIENEIKNAEYDAKYGHNSVSDSKIKNYTNSSVQDLRKAMRNMKPYEEEIQIGGRVITKTSNGYGVRNQYDYDDPMTDYSAYVYGYKEKWIIDEAVKKGELKQTEIKAKVERFKERKGKENDRNTAIANAETYKGETNDLKGKHIKPTSADLSRLKAQEESMLNAYGKNKDGFGDYWLSKYKEATKMRKDAQERIERFKERKGTSSSSNNGSVESLSKQALIEKLVDDQIARGVIKAENRALQIKARKNMTKSELLKYFK